MHSHSPAEPSWHLDVTISHEQFLPPPLLQGGIDEPREQMCPMAQGVACPFPSVEEEDSVSPLRPLRDTVLTKSV